MNVAEKVIEGIAVPVIAVNANLKMIGANALAKQAFKGVENPGGFDEFLTRVNGLLEQLQQTISSGQPTTCKIKAKSGYRSDYTITINCIGTLSGSEACVLLLTFEDRSLFNDLKTMRIGFVANVSHEIRSPLTAISGFVETLQGPAINNVAVRTRFLGLMAKEVTRMTNLVSDLLSLSQAEAKERSALKHRIDLKMVIDQAVESVAPIAAKLTKTVGVKVNDDLPVVIGRHDDLIRVLINLLENAIHYRGRRKVCSLSSAKGEHLANLVVFTSSTPLSRVAEVQWALV